MTDILPIVEWVVPCLAALLIALVLLLLNQKRKSIEWLKWAVSEAEKQLGGGTGQLKLRQVWDWYCGKFPRLASIIPFNLFSKWVDKALDTMRMWLDGNKNFVDYIEGDKS